MKATLGDLGWAFGLLKSESIYFLKSIFLFTFSAGRIEDGEVTVLVEDEPWGNGDFNAFGKGLFVQSEEAVYLASMDLRRTIGAF